MATTYIGPPPVLTTTQRDALVNPPEGMIIDNTTNARLEIQTGAPATPNWIQLVLPISQTTPGYSHNGGAVTQEVNEDFEDTSQIATTFLDDPSNTRVKVFSTLRQNSASTGSLYQWCGSGWIPTPSTFTVASGTGNLTAQGTNTLYSAQSQFGSASIGGDGSHAGWLLSTAGTLFSVQTAGTNSILVGSVNGDTQARVVITPNSIALGPGGSTARDVALSRTSANTLSLSTGTTFTAPNFNATTGFQVNGSALAVANLADGTTGTGTIVLSNAPTLAGTTTINTLNLTNDLAVSNGGTGASTLTTHGVLIGAGTSAINATTAGTSGQLLQSKGSTTNPTWTTATYPTTAGAAGNVPRSNGTNYVDAALSASDVTNAADKASSSAQIFNGAVTPAQIGLTSNGNANTGIAITSSTITANYSYQYLSSNASGFTILTINGNNAGAMLLVLRNLTGNIVNFGTGVNIASSFTLNNGLHCLLMWDTTQPGGAWILVLNNF